MGYRGKRWYVGVEEVGRRGVMFLLGHWMLDIFKTSLLRRFQAQTPPDSTQIIGKFYPFSKIAVPVEPMIN